MSTRARTVAVVVLATTTSAVTNACAMDDVRTTTRTDEAVATFGVTGRNVTIAILDRGIDWRHPDFIRPDGTTRIKWLLDMSGQFLCPGSPAPTEYDEADFNAGLLGGPAPDTRDAVGHGTATAGAAAGNGRAFADGRFRGIAPEADLIIVKLTSEGAPAHGGEPAEAPFQGCIDDALDWLDEKIDALGQPCVAIINSGTQWGPIDGTSAVSRKMDEIFAEDRPGRVCVIPSGDEGSLPNHAGGTFAEGDDAVVNFTKASSATTFGQIWYSGSQPAGITIASQDGAVVGPVLPGQFRESDGLAVFNYHPGTEFYPWRSTSGDRAVWFRIIGHAGPGTIRISALGAGEGIFDAYGDLLGPNLTSILRFTDHLVPGRLTDYASTSSAVVVANSVLRTSWTDIDCIERSIVGEGATGELWLKSSGGPTRDGRRHGVDVTAPGQNTFVSFGSTSYWSRFRFNLHKDGGGWYGRFGGTSGSAPIVTGAVALMLERNPALTAGDVRAILRSTAVSDGLTGDLPNADWGFGRIDVFEAVAAAGRACPEDVDGSGAVGFGDVLRILAAWGPCAACPEDVDGNGTVDFGDLLAVLAAWGACAR
jgi:subtilisin family serine protease